MRRAVAALCILCLSGASAAAASRLDRAAVSAIATRDAHLAPVMRARPLAQLSSVFHPASGDWVASLREPGQQVLATLTIRDADSRVVGARVAPGADAPRALGMSGAAAIAGRSAKVRDWVARYRDHGYTIISQTAYDSDQRLWVRHWWARRGAVEDEIARVNVDPLTRKIRDAWTGPQVAWSMARGGDGAFGKRINDPWIFIPFVLAFVLGLWDWRRLVCLRNLDLLMLASLSISLYYFNQGLVFWSVPLAYPPLVYLFVRLLVIGLRGPARPAFTTQLPTWALIGLAIFALGFRAGLNFWSSNVVDVGYAGVAGADRLLRGAVPYDHMPKQTATPCGAKYSDGTWSGYVQASGRCEAPVERGDTYGPVIYYSYVPFTATLGWSGKWDDLPAAHGTAVLFDALAALGLAVAGWRIGGRRLGAAALYAWATFPFTVYAMSSNSNDPIVAALVAWTLALLTFPFLRGLFVGLAAWAKFAPLLLVPLIVRADREPPVEPLEWPYGEEPMLLGRATLLARLRAAITPGRAGWRALGGFAVATLLAFGILVALDGPHALRLFWDRTFGWQLDRPSPFSIWDWGGYPGFPNLDVEQKLLKALLVVLALGLYVLPRRLDAARVAALAGALLVGFQILLTHWFYLYIPWFVPCVVLALLAPRAGLAAAPAAEQVERPVVTQRALVAAEA